MKDKDSDSDPARDQPRRVNVRIGLLMRSELYSA